jgi:hypothetical protein
VTLLLVLALALPAAPAKFPGLLVQGGFLTPSGNIACNVGRLGPAASSPRGIACSVYSESDKRGIKTWWMRVTGRAQAAHVQANAATDFPKLAYGRTYAWHGIRCTSARTGLTCRNLSGHGFFLSRQRQRIL